jgi:polysaccharide export outer membrane protein
MLSRRLFLTLSLGAVSAAGLNVSAALADKPVKAGEIAFANWTDEEPLYLFYPGDKLEINIAGAPELSRQTQVGPDGRITLGLIGQVMAAFKSVPELQADIAKAYAGVLRDPEVTVYPGETAPMRVLVGGEVKNAGWVDMTGDMDALQAVMAAGGFTHGAKTHEVVLIRRSRDGHAMRRIIDLQKPLSGRSDRLEALRRFDIIYVPRTNIAEAGVFVEQWINNLIPSPVLNYFTYRTFN